MKIEQKSFATLVANFEQETSTEMLVEAEKSKGTFYYEAPDKVRWQYDAPTPKVIVINGDELVTWYQDLHRAEKVQVGRYSDAVFKYLGASGSLRDADGLLLAARRLPQGKRAVQASIWCPATSGWRSDCAT